MKRMEEKNPLVPQQKQTSKKISDQLSDVRSDKKVPQKQKNSYVHQFKILQRTTSFLSQNMEINLNKCLYQTQKMRVFKVINVRNYTNSILKIVLINKKHLPIYQMMLGQAEIYFKRNKKLHEFILPRNMISAIVSSSNIPLSRDISEQQVYLEFVRPYFSGRNFHQEVYVHRKFPFEFEQLSTFMKYALNILNTDTHEHIFIPTLDNIYFDGVSIIGNITSFETYMFLRHFNHHLSTENFKQLYILLPSDPTVFCEWHKMRNYMVQKIRVKAFFLMLFCFCTIRSPIQMIFGQKINQQDLEWARLIDPKTNKINQLNKVITLIRQLPNRWKHILNKIQNKKCLQMASLKLFFELKNRDQTFETMFYEIEDFQYSDQERNFLYNLYVKIFVNEENYGWKDFFELKKKYKKMNDEVQNIKTQENVGQKRQRNYLEGSPIRRFIIQDAKQLNTIQDEKETYQRRKQRQQRENKLFNCKEQQNETGSESEQDRLYNRGQKIYKIQESLQNQSQNIRFQRFKTNNRQCKLQTAKAGFLYLHMYFVQQDIKERKLTPLEAINYVNSLNFQIYLPLKIGLSLTITLDYEEWFEVFFQEIADERPEVYDAAKFLYELLACKSLEILNCVKGCELIHLKRIQFLTGQKLSSNKTNNSKLLMYESLKSQLTDFAQNNRLYEQTIWSLRQAIRCSGGTNQKQSVKKMVDDLSYYFAQGNVYQDIHPLFFSLTNVLDKQMEQNLPNSPSREKNSQKIRKFTKKNFTEELKKMLEQIRGHALIKKSFNKKINHF